MNEVEIVFENHPPDGWCELINEGVDQYNISDTGVDEWHPVQLFLKGAGGECLGGLLGTIWGGWLQVDSLWVTDALRGKGHGTSLLAGAERYALEKGCFASTLDTHSVEAKRLYEKLGYKLFATLQDFPPGRSKFFLRKSLADQAIS